MALAILLGGPAPAEATTLSATVAGMSPGTFAELTPMIGWDNGGILNPSDVAGCVGGDYITQYADKAAWDPVHQRVLFIGQTHGNCYAGRLVMYSDSTNTWTQGPYPPGICQSGTANNPCFSHAYSHNAIDPTTGDMYYRQSYGLKFFALRNSAWSSLPSPALQSSQCCGALEFFPELGRLLFLDGDWGLWSFNPTSNGWSQVANTNVANATAGLPNLPMSSYTNFAVYNPVRHVVLFGGRDTLYEIDAAGMIKKKGSPAVELAYTSAVTGVDTIGGEYIVLSGSSVYAYNGATDTWKLLPVALPAVLKSMGGVGDGLVQASMTTYGAILYMKYDFAGSKVYLYKHSPGSGTPYDGGVTGPVSDGGVISPGPDARSTSAQDGDNPMLDSSAGSDPGIAPDASIGDLHDAAGAAGQNGGMVAAGSVTPGDAGGDSSGCACECAGLSGKSGTLSWFLFGLVTLAQARRRRHS